MRIAARAEPIAVSNNHKQQQLSSGNHKHSSTVKPTFPRQSVPIATCDSPSKVIGIRNPVDWLKPWTGRFLFGGQIHFDGLIILLVNCHLFVVNLLNIQSLSIC